LAVTRFDPVVLCPAGCRQPSAPAIPKPRFELGSLVVLDEAPEFCPSFARTGDRLRLSHTANFA
jgi:hypothetical protein